MEPSQDAGQGGRTRASSRRGARAVEDGAGERGRGVDKVARGTVACAGAAERERTLRASNDPATVAAAEKGPGGDKAMVHKNAVEDGAGERGRSINKVARGTVACAVEKGAVERDCTLRASNAPATVAAAEKGPGGDKAMVHKGLDKNEGRFIYNAEVDSYTLEPIGTKEKRPYILPGNIYRYLFEYQQEGIAWLWGIHCQQNGAIVADDMGLGKTFQAAAFLSGLFRSDLVKKVIVIVPLTVLDQWPEELKKAEIYDLVHVYHDCDDTGLKTVLKSHGILLTTYETYKSNHMKLMGSSRACWDYAILDEAHRIKNIKSKTTCLVNKIHSKKKILLTGTPIQKDLMDLYSLLNFISPDLFGDAATFRKNYVHPVTHGRYADASETEKADYKRAVEDARMLTTTYMLRRGKQVLIESGHLSCKKHDMVVWLTLTELQIKLYRKCEEIYMSRSGQRRESAFLKSTIWQAICNSPAVLLNIHTDDNEEVTNLKSLKDELVDSFDARKLNNQVNSCKATFIFDLIKEIFEEEQKEIEDENKRELKEKEKKHIERKILIFSRSLNMLDIIEESLINIVEEEKISRIDGSVERDKRAELIKRFKSNDGPKILLLSARVGGEGLNLTAATRLIIVDPSWNSSDDSQISDRIYRMGQKKDVYIYRLVTCNTVEEHTYKTQLLKGALGRCITEGMISASSVYNKEGKILSLPDKKGGFHTSETFDLLDCRESNKLDFDGRHLNFLMSHRLVYGITNQNFVLSNDETALSDFPHERDVWSGIGMNRKFHRPEEFKQVSSDMSIKGQRIAAASKQHGLISTEVSMDIPENKVGLIIGRDGQTIRKIRLSSSAIVSVESKEFGPSSPKRSIKIMGTIKAIEKAKQMISDLISESEKMLSKASESRQSGGKEEFLSVPDDIVGKVIGFQGRTVRDINQKSGAYVQFVEHKRRFSLKGSQEQIEFAKGLIHQIIDKAAHERREEKHVAVPETMIGLVIGKNGCTLTELKQKSGASIQFIDPLKKFLLSGSQQAIDSAEALMMEIIDKSCREKTEHPHHGGHKPTSTRGSIVGSRSERESMTSNRSEYYGERGPNEQRSCTPRRPRNF